MNLQWVMNDLVTASTHLVSEQEKCSFSHRSMPFVAHFHSREEMRDLCFLQWLASTVKGRIGCNQDGHEPTL